VLGRWRSAWPPLTVVVVIVSCLRLPETKAAGAAGLRPADPGSGAAGARCDVSGLGAGEHAGRRDSPQKAHRDMAARA
jgi:hypothetical protein